MNIIKAGFLISYDYKFIKISLPLVYPYLAECILCIDVNRKTWTGQDIYIPDTFFEWLKRVDTDNKITIYEDNFYIPELTVMECETRERNMLSKKMGKCDWYLQIDTDEYMMDFGLIARKLKYYSAIDPVTIFGRVAPLFKKTQNGFLIITDAPEYLPFITNYPQYTYARNNDKNRKIIWHEFIALHQSWAREDDEIKMKLSNWGHKDDFNTASFYKLWHAIDEHNYIYIRDFHPLVRPAWPQLEFIPNPDIINLIEEKSTIYKYYPI